MLVGWLAERHPEVAADCRYFKFAGRRQRQTPVADAKTLVHIILLLPGWLPTAIALPGMVRGGSLVRDVARGGDGRLGPPILLLPPHEPLLLRPGDAARRRPATPPSGCRWTTVSQQTTPSGASDNGTCASKLRRCGRNIAQTEDAWQNRKLVGRNLLSTLSPIRDDSIIEPANATRKLPQIVVTSNSPASAK